MACARLMCVLSADEENRSDMAYTNDFLPALEASFPRPEQLL